MPHSCYNYIKVMRSEIQKRRKEQEIKQETKKKTLKESFIELLHSPKDLIILGIPLLFLIMTLIPVPYYITAGGGTINISDRIEIANSYSEEGSLNSAYVKNYEVMFLLIY